MHACLHVLVLSHQGQEQTFERNLENKHLSAYRQRRPALQQPPGRLRRWQQLGHPCSFPSGARLHAGACTRTCWACGTLTWPCSAPQVSASAAASCAPALLLARIFTVLRLPSPSVLRACCC